MKVRIVWSPTIKEIIEYVRPERRYVSELSRCGRGLRELVKDSIRRQKQEKKEDGTRSKIIKVNSRWYSVSNLYLCRPVFCLYRVRSTSSVK